MPHFFAGDELGAIKSISYAIEENAKEWKATTAILVPGGSQNRSKAVQKLVSHRTPSSDVLLMAAHANGFAAVHRVAADGSAEVVHRWDEPRLKAGQRFVGLAATDSAVYTCTSNGALRLTKPGHEDSEPTSSIASLPMRLSEWRLSNDGCSFAYGGEEVETSVWDTEKAFAPKEPSPESHAVEIKKRKRGDQLLPGEVWRAKNVPNDHLGLRQAVHNTALTYLQASTSVAHQHLLVGTAHGNIRRYDTRAGRRPVSDWKGVGKTGGINTVEKGSSEHEVFVADRGCTLSALDLRNGRVIYSYKGIAGAITSVAPAGSFAASASQDRFVRLHSAFGPPTEPGQQQEQKGEVLNKSYVKVTPTVVVWDGTLEQASGNTKISEVDEGADDVWDAMQDVDSESEGERPRRRKEKKHHAA